MQNITIIGILIVSYLFVSACSNPYQKKQFNDFEYEQDFQKNKSLFRKDVLPIEGFSTEGSEMFVFKSAKRKYTVYDVWFYGELMQRNTSFFVDEQNKPKLIKQTIYLYDRPISVEGATFKTLVTYFTYNNGISKYYSKIKLEIADNKLKAKKQKELERLFARVTKSVQMNKKQVKN